MAPDFIFVPSGKGFEKLTLATLLYIRKGKGQTELVTTEGSILTTADLSQFEKTLYQCGFYRVHGAYLVSLDRIICFDRRTVELPGIVIPLEKKYSAGLKQRVRIIIPFTDLAKHCRLSVGADGQLAGI